MNVILIDDEQIALEYMQLQLKDMPNVHVMGAYVNPEEGLQHAFNQDVDVVFLDIHMPEEDGVSLAHRILEKRPNMLIVFVTAFEQYAVDAFDLNAVDYIVKPVNRKRLEKTIDRMQARLQNKQEIASEKKDVLYIQMCKQFQLQPMQEAARIIRWRTARVKEMFLLLLHKREQIVSKEQITDLLWPDVDIERANAQLYTTVYHIRKVLQDFKQHFTLKNANNGYILFTKDIEIDVEKWEQSLESLPPLNSHTVDVYESVMADYQHSYLSDHHYIWTIPRAERLDQKWIDMAFKIAQQYEHEKRDTEAFKWYLLIAERFPETEEAHFALMKHYQKQNKTAYVKRQYNTLIEVLDAELGLQPSAYITNWYEQWSSAGGEEETLS